MINDWNRISLRYFSDGSIMRQSIKVVHLAQFNDPIRYVVGYVVMNKSNRDAFPILRLIARFYLRERKGENGYRDIGVVTTIQ